MERSTDTPTAWPRVSVVIPNWNGLRHLPDCLASLASQSFTDFEIRLVDNASSDESLAWVEEHHPEVRTVRRPDNGGFAKAVNAGITAAQTEYVALLNNDTAADTDWLRALVDALDDHRSYDLAASRIVLFDEPERLNAAGDIWSLRHMKAENRGFGEPSSRYETMERVLGACAGAALYRRALFDEVGLFDEDFFLMHEDTDFNLRCLIAGKHCLYVPGARVRHKCGASIRTAAAPEMTRLLIRNEAFVAAKDLPLAMLVPRSLLSGCLIMRQTIPLRPSNWHLIPARVRQLKGTVRTELEGYRMGLAKRSHVRRSKAVGTLQILRWLLRGSGPL